VTFQPQFQEPNRLPNRGAVLCLRQHWVRLFHARSIEKYASKAINASSQESIFDPLQVSDRIYTVCSS
jgi:hypothetical protein